MNEKPAGKPCIRCLTADLPQGAALSALLRERVAALPAEEKAPEEEILRRLAVCRACDHLHAGTCAICGCYVEVRAARRRMDCPAVPARWSEGPGVCNKNITKR